MYCVNPACPNPNNPDTTRRCQSCGANLLLRDRYQTIKALGQGGFGATFIARDRALPSAPVCVIKQLRPASESPRVLEMARQLFAREAKTLGRVGDHPQVPRLLDYFAVKDPVIGQEFFYLVQEYIAGKNLKQEVKASGLFTEERAKDFLRQILPLIKYLHENEVIHRDIKPANIIRRDIDQKLVLIDFGAVKDEVNQTIMSNNTGETAFTSFAIGTPGFAPQEQMALRPVYASDIYAIGATCLYLLTGQSPKNFGYDPLTCEIIWRPSVQISDGFAAILTKMLAAGVRDRYHSADEVLQALDLESHSQDLAQSMMTRPIAQTQVPEETTQIDTEDSKWLPEHIRQARAIRDRKAKKEKTILKQGLTMNTGIDPRTVAQSGGSGGSHGRTHAKITPDSEALDAHGVRLAYTKGKRDFIECDLVGLNLQNSILQKANFYHSKLDRVNLEGSDLFNASFDRSSLTQANLRNANLSKASFLYANLSGADLRGADLSYASFNYANLRGVNLCGANLTGAMITDQQLSYARTNWMTIKPNGKRSFFG